MTLTKALIINKDTGLSIPVMFNPPEYQLQKTNQFAEIGIPGLGSSLLQFVKGSSQTMTMELFFDTTGSNIGGIFVDVRIFTNKVISLIDINPKTHGPPELLFIWGSLVFDSVLESVTQKFDYFSPEGLPLRARLTVTLKGNNKLEDMLSKIPLESSDRTKMRVFKAGETLQAIAAEEYKDPGKWRPIAKANNIDSPLSMKAGQKIIIPSLIQGET